jgi:hypothetical protein
MKIHMKMVQKVAMKLEQAHGRQKKKKCTQHVYSMKMKVKER